MSVLTKGFDTALAARECLQETDRLVKEFGPRLAGTEACSGTAERIAESLRDSSDSVMVEPFRVHPDSFYSYTKILPVSYLLGIVALYAAARFAPIPIIGLVAGIVLMVCQFAFYRHFADRLFSRAEAENVEAVIEPSGTVQRELILSGHHDSAPVARIFAGPFARFYAVAIMAPYVFFVFELGLLLFGLFGGASTPGWTLPCVLAGLPFVVAYFFLVALHRGSPGAGDNLISSVMVAVLGRELAARKPDLLRSTRIRIVSFDAEEAGLRGASYYFRKHAAELKRLPCFHLNFDSLYAVRDLQILTRDINGTIPLSGNLVDIVVDCARESGISLRRFGLIFGAGGTDAAESARCGIPSTTIIAMPTELVRDGLVYHTPSDTTDHIEPGVVESCMRIALRLLERLEAGESGPSLARTARRA
jgi:hypothetical protein